MHEPTYRQAISSAWKAIWENKTIWIFGLLSAFIGQLGVGNLLGYLWMAFERAPYSSKLFNIYLNFPEFGWRTYFGLMLLVIMGLMIALLLVFISVTAQGTIITYIYDWFKNGKGNITKSWDYAVSKFWNLFSIILTEKVLVGATVIVISLLVRNVANSDFLWVKIILGLIIFILIILALAISISAIYALGYTLVEKRGYLQSVLSGVNLLYKHILVSLEIVLFILILQILLIFFLSLLSYIALLPSMAIWIIAGITNKISLMGIGLLIGMFIWMIMIVLVGAVFNAFNTAIWTYLFIKMHKEGMVSRLLHWIKFRK